MDGLWIKLFEAFRTQLYARNPTIGYLVLSPKHPCPTKNHLSSPVKHFADHKRDEVQAFGYDKDLLHQLAAFGEQDFLDFLGVDNAFLNVDPPGQQPSRTQPSGKKKKGSGKKKKGSGKKASGRRRAESQVERPAQRPVERAPQMPRI
jgi:hypothetical protein